MDDQNRELFQKAIAEGDEWLLEQGVVSDVSKNTIISNIYVKYKRVKFLDFDLDERERIIDMRLYVGFWTLLLMTIFGRARPLLDNVFSDLDAYLKGHYQIRVTIQRFSKRALERNYLE